MVGDIKLQQGRLVVVVASIEHLEDHCLLKSCRKDLNIENHGAVILEVKAKDGTINTKGWFCSYDCLRRYINSLD
jgi:hypothetical protein